MWDVDIEIAQHRTLGDKEKLMLGLATVSHLFRCWAFSPSTSKMKLIKLLTSNAHAHDYAVTEMKFEDPWQAQFCLWQWILPWHLVGYKSILAAWSLLMNGTLGTINWAKIWSFLVCSESVDFLAIVAVDTTNIIDAKLKQSIRAYCCLHEPLYL